MAFFQDFPVLENAITNFQDFPGFPGPVRTLDTCVRPPPIDTLGRKSSRSYGLKPLQLTCLFIPREVTFLPGESENHNKFLSLKEHALALITGGSVQGVPLPTSAPNVEVIMQPEIVQREGSNQPQALSLVE